MPKGKTVREPLIISIQVKILESWNGKDMFRCNKTQLAIYLFGLKKYIRYAVGQIKRQ